MYFFLNFPNKKAIPILCKILLENEDKNLLSDCCWALSYIDDFLGKKGKIMQEYGIISRLVNFLRYFL